MSSGDDPQRSPVRASELTTELPAFVRDAVGQPREALTAEDLDTVAALVELGVDDAAAREAVLADRVPIVLTQQVLGQPEEMSLVELSEASGVPADVLERVRLATGLSTQGRFSTQDLRWAELLGELLDAIPVEAVVRSARARGSALATIARSDLGMVRDELVLPMRQAGADDLTVSVALAETARSLEELAQHLLVSTYRLHLQQELGSELVAIATRTGAPEVDLAVGFVDVVGYTALSSRIDPAGLEQVIDAFEDRIIHVVSSHDEVSAVKYMGDAVMLVAPDVGAMADALLDLTEEVAPLSDAPLRGGFAYGPTLVREGDYFGPAVNLAARLTDIARPWTVLGAEELADSLAGRYETRRILPTRIRGVGLRRPLAVSRGAGDAGR